MAAADQPEGPPEENGSSDDWVEGPGGLLLELVGNCDESSLQHQDGN